MVGITLGRRPFTAVPQADALETSSYKTPVRRGWLDPYPAGAGRGCLDHAAAAARKSGCASIRRGFVRGGHARESQEVGFIQGSWRSCLDGPDGEGFPAATGPGARPPPATANARPP